MCNKFCRHWISWTLLIDRSVVFVLDEIDADTTVTDIYLRDSYRLI